MNSLSDRFSRSYMAKASSRQRRSDGAAMRATRGHMRGGRVHDHHAARKGAQPRPHAHTIWHRLAKTTTACYRAADNDAADVDPKQTTPATLTYQEHARKSGTQKNKSGLTEIELSMKEEKKRAARLKYGRQPSTASGSDTWQAPAQWQWHGDTWQRRGH